MPEAYENDPFFFAYLKWHYGRGLKEFFGVVGNSLWFISQFFSFKLLLKTLFAPWKRLGERYGGGLNLGAWASSFLVNCIIRGFGFVTRSLVLLVGFASYAAVIGLSSLVLLLWVFAPLILLGSLTLSALFFVV